MQKKKGKIITVTSCKGGVGKTIIALNLAGIYSNLKMSVLVIDLDIYGGNIATYLNSSNDRTGYNFIEDYTHNRYETIGDYIYKYNDFISCIAAPKDPRIANKIDSKYIPILLDTVLYKFDIILIDTSHILNEINIVALDNSDSILYVFTNDSFDLKNTRTFMNIIKDINYKNIYTVLNNSIFYKDYYSLYDIRNIINYNIDFTLPKGLYIKNIDKYILDSKIPTLLNHNNKHFTDIALKLIKEEVKVK